MKVISLCDGHSCAKVSLDRAEIPVTDYYASEVNIHSEAVSKCNHANMLRMGDVKGISYKKGELKTERGNFYVGDVDLLIAGWPCKKTSSSQAKWGKRGLYGESALLYDILKLRDAVKPKNFFFENVFSMGESLQEECSKLIGVKPLVVDAVSFAPVSRKRLFWTDIPVTELPGERKDGVTLKDIIEDGYVDRDVSYAIDANYGKGSSLDLYYKWCRRQIVFTDENKQSFRILTPTEAEVLMGLPKGYTEYGYYMNGFKQVAKTNRYKMIGDGWHIDAVSYLLKFLKTGKQNDTI